MICYLFRFRYKDKALTSGITYNLDKIYRKNNPLYCDDKNALMQICSELNTDFFSLKLEYCKFGDEIEAKSVLIDEDKMSKLEWREFISKTFIFDKNHYLRLLKNHLETCRKINYYDKKLHQFLFDNFNPTENYIYFTEIYKKPEGWNLLDKKAKKRYTERLLHLDKRYELEPNYFIKVFSGYEFDDSEDKSLKIIYKINSNKIPYIVASMYNSIAFTSHIINNLGIQKIPVNKEELPFYYAIKPLILYYTKERYQKEIINKTK